jgi:hypothetical protein
VRPQLITAVLVVLLTAGISQADSALPDDPVAGCEDVTGATGTSGSDGESGVLADESTGPTGPTGEDCEEPEPTGVTGGGDEGLLEDGDENGVDGDEPVSGDREAECLATADTEPTNGDGEDDGDDAVTGLDTAITHVLENCLENPKAPGLLTALDRLTDNRDRHNVHGPTKAAEARAKGIAAGEGGGPPWEDDGGPGNGHGNPHA